MQTTVDIEIELSSWKTYMQAHVTSTLSPSCLLCIFSRMFTRHCYIKRIREKCKQKGHEIPNRVFLQLHQPLLVRSYIWASIFGNQNVPLCIVWFGFESQKPLSKPTCIVRNTDDDVLLWRNKRLRLLEIAGRAGESKIEDDTEQTIISRKKKCWTKCSCLDGNPKNGQAINEKLCHCWSSLLFRRKDD